MKISRFRILMLACLWLVSGAVLPVSGKDHKEKEHKESKSSKGLEKATVLIIRHAEKPDEGRGLTPAGEARADAYVKYFENYTIDGSPIKLTALFAAAPSAESERPYLTILPLSKAIGLPIDTQYKDKDYSQLVEALKSSDHGKDILICWHHGEIADLLTALGADANSLIPGGKWPGDQYGWVMQLQFDKESKVKDAQRIVEPF